MSGVTTTATTQPGSPSPDLPETTTSTIEKGGDRPGSLYRAVWRWHFYAGLFAIPVIVLLCLTGMTYLFRPQLDDLLYGPMRHVAPGASVVDYSQQLATVKAHFPDGSVGAVMPAPTADRSTQFEVTAADGSPWSAYVNPYTGGYLGARNHYHDPSFIALKLHGSLWTGAWLGWLPGGVDPALWGDWYIELVTCWTLVLVISGCYLWWPRGRRKFDGVLLPRLSARNRRIRWRDVHAITGVLFSFITVFFLISGLVWTGFWSPKVLQPALKGSGSYYPDLIMNGVTSTKVGDLTTGSTVNWASSTLPVPLSGEPGNPVQHAGHHGVGKLSWDPSKGAPVDAVIATAQAAGFIPGYAVFLPADDTAAYTVVTGEDLDPKPVQPAGGGHTLFVDQYTARPIAAVGEKEFAIPPQVIDWSVSVHTGREWGWVSQLLALLGASMILLSVATSLVMWRARRPKGLGAPRREPDRRRMLGVAVITAVLAVIFPLLGGSILLVLALDHLLVRRVPKLARGFGVG